jgi:hypothetical protein
VNVAAIDDQIVRDTRQRVLRRGAVAELDDVVVRGMKLLRCRKTAAPSSGLKHSCQVWLGYSL